MDLVTSKHDFSGVPQGGAGKAVCARRRRWGLRAGLLLLGWCALAAILPALRGAGPASLGANPSNSPRDMTLAVQVRRALLDDPTLGPLNLAVKVQDGVVVLAGPVPAPELARQALRKSAEVRGVRGVQSELYLSRDTGHERIPIPLADEPTTRTQSASPDPLTGGLGTLTGRVPAIELPPSGRPSTTRPEAPPQAPARVPGPGVSLLAPVVDVPPTPAPAAEPLGPAVERVRQGNPRFRRIQVEVRGTTVFLSGPEVPGEDVMALAQALSVLPGVERVLVRSGPSSGR